VSRETEPVGVARAVAIAWRILPRRLRGRALPLLALMLLASVTEVVGLGSLPVFLGLFIGEAPLLDHAWAQWAIAQAGLSDPRHLLYAVGTGIALIFVLQTGLHLLMAYGVSAFTGRVVARIGEDLFEGYLRAPMQFHFQRHSAHVASRIGIEALRFADGFVQRLLLGLQSAILVLGVVVLLAVTAPARVLVLCMAVGALSALIVLAVRKRGQRAGRAYTHANAALNEYAAETHGALHHIRLRGLEPNLLADFRQTSRARGRAIRFERFANNIPRPLLEGLAIVGMMGIAFLMVAEGAEVASVVPMLGLLAAAVGRMLPHLITVVRSLIAMIQHTSVVASLAADLDAFRAHAATAAAAPAGPVPAGPLLSDRLRLDDVSYAYPGSDLPSIQSISLDIPKNAAVAFVGPTGAGKSTLVALICGLIAPDSGRIRIDGTDLNACRTAWQRHIGYIPQSIFLANRSLRENVALGLRPAEIDDDRVREVLAQAQLDSFVDGLPQGLDTQVGENGVRLSGGQRQRVGIARALYHDPEVLVLDEATAALDNDTERRLMAAIEAVRQERTLIMIAHRLSSIRNCERIFVLEDGRLTGSGRYDELLDGHPAFRALAAA